MNYSSRLNFTFNKTNNNKNPLFDNNNFDYYNVNNFTDNKNNFCSSEHDKKLYNSEYTTEVDNPINENSHFSSFMTIKTNSKNINNNYKDSNPNFENVCIFNSNIFTNNYSIRKSNNQNFNTINGIQKIKKYIIEKKINENKFFMHFFNNKINDSNLMSKTQFYNSLKKYAENIKEEEANEIFDYIDNGKKEKINYNQLLSFYIINQNNKTINNKFHSNINKLFDKYDKEKKEIISINNFNNCLKSINHTISKKDIYKMFQIYFNIENPSGINNIKKNDFISLISNYIFKEINFQNEERQKIIKVFTQNANNSNGFLNKKQLKYILKNKLNYDFEEIDILCDKLSEEYDDLIDCESFIQNLDKLKLNDDDNNSLINEIGLNFYFKLHIKSKRRTIFEKYPFLIPSFFREQQKKLNLLPSSTLIPKKDFNGKYYYEDMKQINYNKNIKILSPINSIINCKIFFIKYAMGIPIPNIKLFINKNSQLKICKKLLKLGLYDIKKKKFIINSISIECQNNEKYLNRWIFEMDRTNINNNIIIRYNNNDIENIKLLFEFVIIINDNNNINNDNNNINNNNNNEYVEVSCGWTYIDLENLKKTACYTLGIKGGNINKPQNINLNDIKVDNISNISFQNKTLNDFTIEDKNSINFIPQNIICYRAGIYIIAIFRKIIWKTILNQINNDRILKENNEIIHSFCKIFDCFDAFNFFIQFWRENIINQNINNEKILEQYFIQFNNRIFTALYAEEFKYDTQDPTKFQINNIIIENRLNLIRSALKYNNKDIKKSQLNYKSIYDYTNVKPFSINQITGNKIDIINKKYPINHIYG